MFTDYTADHLKANHQRAEEMGLANARAKALTPQQVVEIDASARHAAMRAQQAAGKPIDFSAAGKAGAEAVEAARIAAVPGRAST